jgi:XTP/dITP diphosphohydrolase
MEKINLIFATHNDHKHQEVLEILGNGQFNVQNLKQIGFYDEIEETGITLEENALIKARAIYQKTGLDVFSDDSGLEVEALDMLPGVNTARYAGPQKNADDNMDKLLDELKQKKNRNARFRAVVALIWEGKEHLFEGIVNGQIAMKKSGRDGFGYDPIFIPEGFDKSFAELSAAIKNTMSHRYNSMDLLKNFFSKNT